MTGPSSTQNKDTAEDIVEIVSLLREGGRANRDQAERERRKVTEELARRLPLPELLEGGA